MSNPNTQTRRSPEQAESPFDGSELYLGVVEELRSARAANGINLQDDSGDRAEWLSEKGTDGVSDLLRLAAESKAENNPGSTPDKYENDLIDYMQTQIQFNHSQSHVNMKDLEGDGEGSEELSNLDSVLEDLDAKKKAAQSIHKYLDAAEEQKKIDAVTAYAQTIRDEIEPVDDVAKRYVMFSEMLAANLDSSVELELRQKVADAKVAMDAEAEQYRLHAAAYQVLSEYYPADPSEVDDQELAEEEPIELPNVTTSFSMASAGRRVTAAASQPVVLPTTSPARPAPTSTVPQPTAPVPARPVIQTPAPTSPNVLSPAQAAHNKQEAEALENAKFRLDALRSKMAKSGASRSGKLWTGASGKESYDDIEAQYAAALQTVGRLENKAKLTDPNVSKETKNIAAIGYIFREQARLRDATNAAQKNSKFNKFVGYLNKHRVQAAIGVTALTLFTGGSFLFAASATAGGLIAAKHHQSKLGMESANDSIDSITMLDYLNRTNGDIMEEAVGYGMEVYEDDVEKEQRKRRTSAAIGVAAVAGSYVAAPMAGQHAVSVWSSWF